MWRPHRLRLGRRRLPLLRRPRRFILTRKVDVGAPDLCRRRLRPTAGPGSRLGLTPPPGRPVGPTVVRPCRLWPLGPCAVWTVSLRPCAIGPLRLWPNRLWPCRSRLPGAHPRPAVATGIRPCPVGRNYSRRGIGVGRGVESRLALLLGPGNRRGMSRRRCGRSRRGRRNWPRLLSRRGRRNTAGRRNRPRLRKRRNTLGRRNARRRRSRARLRGRCNGSGQIGCTR
jgi:hypothetical protein